MFLCAFQLPKKHRWGIEGLIRFWYPPLAVTAISDGHYVFTLDEAHMDECIAARGEYRGPCCGRADCGCSPEAISQWMANSAKGGGCQCMYCSHYCGQTYCDCAWVEVELMLEVQEL